MKKLNKQVERWLHGVTLILLPLISVWFWYAITKAITSHPTASLYVCCTIGIVYIPWFIGWMIEALK